MTVYAVAAVLGAVLIALGVVLWCAQLGLVVAGVELIAFAYVGAYLTRHMEAPK